MLLRILGHTFHYEMENLCRVFYPNETIKTVTNRDGGGDIVETVLFSVRDGRAAVRVWACIAGKEAACDLSAELADDAAESFDSLCERRMAQALFRVLSDFSGYVPPWGILTGVRPSKLMMKLMADYGDADAGDYFRNQLYVSEEKIALTQRVTREEQAALAASVPESFSLYVSMPFCPSRCAYCSFVSHSITNQNAKKLLPDYIWHLCEEIRESGNVAAELGLRCESVYFGGGTPTVLQAHELDSLCDAVARSFDLSAVREYTVEAGRPDTLTAEKLAVLRRHGVTRVSVNPQSFQDAVLQNIGRAHSADAVFTAFRLVREAGFPCVNMDLIAGLPGDTAEGFRCTLETALALAPENLTVHTLALKRASELAVSGQRLPDGRDIEIMLACARNLLEGQGYRPYYMYRQSRSLGNHENVGWCRGDTACLYNIYMMEECHTVLGVGAGAVTKLKQPGSDYLERVFNFKYPYEYNTRFSEMLARKTRIKTFYQKY